MKWTCIVDASPTWSVLRNSSLVLHKRELFQFNSLKVWLLFYLIGNTKIIIHMIYYWNYNNIFCKFVGNLINTSYSLEGTVLMTKTYGFRL